MDVHFLNKYGKNMNYLTTKSIYGTYKKKKKKKKKTKKKTHCFKYVLAFSMLCKIFCRQETFFFFFNFFQKTVFEISCKSSP